MPETAYIALGSNLGDREQNLRQALDHLAQVATVVRVSSFLETDPVGGPEGQGKYLNAAAEITTDLDPVKLLQTLLGIEVKLGRVRTEAWGPRTLDLDLLLYGSQKVDIRRPDLDLVVPHPRLHERAFVLEPLVEIAPLAVHPVFESTVRDLWRRLQGQEQRELTGWRALVTGSTSGIGRAIALELARAGAGVIIHGRQRSPHADAVLQKIQDLSGPSAFIAGDLAEESNCRQVADAAWQTWDGLDICINNAGADTLTGEAGRWPFERKLAQLWAVDVRATMLLSRDLGQRMRLRGRGVIVNMGWDQAETGMEGDSGQLFAATKGAVMAFSKSLARSLAPLVRVHCLAPGWIRTAWGDQASAPWQERVLRETPMARWGTPQDVATAARFLISPSADFFTGQTLRVNGGSVM